MVRCNHIQPILQDDKLKESVLKTYNVIKYILTHSTKTQTLLYTMRCNTCEEINCGSNFICLQCEFTGCWNHEHFLAHSKEKNHLYGINSSNQLMFCFKCMDYIGDVELINMSYLNKAWDDISLNTQVPAMPKRDGLMGFVNMGSTCFISSIIQCLIHNPYIVNFSMSQQHYNQCQTKDPSQCISCALDTIIAETYGNLPSSNNSHDGFISLLNCAWKINQNFAGYSQQDAHEFLQFILNQLHNDFKRVEHRKSVTGGTYCNCLIHSMFQGALKSSIVCTECQDDSKTIIDPFMDLSLDIKDKSTLYECLDSFHKREQLHDFNYHCPGCNTSEDPTKQLTINTSGPVLSLQLKRFEHLANGNNVKLTQYVEFPLYLDMSKYYDDANDSETKTPSLVYELIGIVSHKGTVNEGHYIATLKVSNDKWFRFNDSMVSEISQEQALKDEAYLLFYVIKQAN